MDSADQPSAAAAARCEVANIEEEKEQVIGDHSRETPADVSGGGAEEDAVEGDVANLEEKEKEQIISDNSSETPAAASGDGPEENTAAACENKQEGMIFNTSLSSLSHSLRFLSLSHPRSLSRVHTAVLICRISYHLPEYLQSGGQRRSAE